MTVSLTFHGAAGTVTGSCYLIRYAEGAFLVDAGLFQGPKTVRELNYNPTPFDPAQVRFVLLTHAHIDHSGLLPKLIKGGFRGRVLATEETRDLLAFMLPDSGHIQELEVDQLNRRNARRGRDLVSPIYDRRDAERAVRRIVPIPYDRWVRPAPCVRARFWNSGHILGSASIEVEVTSSPSATPVRILFSGDLGPEHKMFHPDPAAPARLDHLVLEATYGNRDREPITPEKRRSALRSHVLHALRRGGNLVIPAFAVERTQELIVDLIHLFSAGEIPRVPVYLDSPLALRATATFARYAARLEDLPNSDDAFTAPNVHYMETSEQSAAIGRIAGGAIIISASGMCDAGRIRDHLRNNLWRKGATILLVGYQAPGTLGRLLQDGAKAVRIRGEEVLVGASICQLDAYSGHADRRGLVRWAQERLPIEGTVFLVHGEAAALAGLSQALLEVGCLPEKTVVPELDQQFELGPGTARAMAPHTRRLSPEALDAPDWHNEHSALLLDIEAGLRNSRNDRERDALLQRLRVSLSASAKCRR